MMIASRSSDDHDSAMPAEPQRLSRAQARRIAAVEERIDKAEARVQEARLEWARTVREFGISATARHYGITPQAVTSRLRAIEGREN
jgi:methylphosphotriester-DNA--protein-cysteine methyltransferase